VAMGAVVGMLVGGCVAVLSTVHAEITSKNPLRIKIYLRNMGLSSKK
jgi:hypothetical protein